MTLANAFFVLSHSLSFLPKLCAAMGSSYALYQEMLLTLVIRTGKELKTEANINRNTSIHIYLNDPCCDYLLHMHVKQVKPLFFPLYLAA